MMKRYVYRFVLLAFLIRALVPVGFMLQASQTRGLGFDLVICTSQGPQTLHQTQAQTLKMTEGGGQHHQKSHQDTCPFATLALLGYSSSPTELSATVAYAAVTYRRVKLQFSETPTPSANSARGPPLLA